MSAEPTVQHTPGPWNVGVQGRIEGPRSVLADVHGYRGKAGPANSRLIAAAPDLLAAAEAAFSGAIHSGFCAGEGNIDAECDCFMVKLALAIAKATR